MLKGRRTRKIVAATLLLIFATNTFAPNVANALTSGPTAPEATSFEPIDTTDMVNMQTGDFTYNIPVLEVPGPEGGYPLSLSYHAGIQPNEDASWVGLGWTLNPGAINRYVNGYADDWYNPTGTSHVYWQGGNVKTYNVGVSVGIANTPATVSFGLSFSSDTYRGFGVGMDLGFGGRLGGKKSPLSAAVNFGISSYGDAYASGQIGASKGPLSASIGLSTNFESLEVGAAASMNFGIGSLSINNRGRTSWAWTGYSSAVASTKEAGIQTKTNGFNVDIPTPWGFNISLGYKKTRYWTDETTTAVLHGGLYSSGWGEDPSNMNVYDNVGYDCYSLLEDPGYKNIIDNPDPQKVQGGAFPDFDVYTVNAQGLGGNMRPYLFEGEVLGQNKKDENNNQLVTYYSPGVTNSGPQFRFIGDFSNSYRQNYPDYSNPALNLRIVAPPFDGSPVYGNGDGSYGLAGGGGNALAGSRHIDVGVKVQPSNILGYNKADRYQSYMIDGFSITNESGVTYHYGLPAYAWDEETYQERMDHSGGIAGNRSKKPTAYAYTWYLTTITGPDFVDRDGDQKAGSNDWGYWVNFEYGKWANNYIWRNPSEGFHRDEDNEWQDCSMGHKEVYYLNAIRTRSHTAMFQKEARNDGWGESPQIFVKNYVSSVEQDYTYPGLFNPSGTKSMRLSHIYLLDNNSNINPNVIAATGTQSYPGGIGANVIDQEDLTPSFDANAIRIIDFNYDYSLCKGVSNNLGGPPTDNGKLTLKFVKFRGKGGASLLPSTKFEYDLTGSEVRSQSGVSLSPTSFSTTNGNFEIGDLIMNDFPVYCGVITAKSSSAGTHTYTLKNGNYTGGTVTCNVYTTKNPPYNKNAYDLWGMYKSDFDNAVILTNENLGRVTSQLSSKSVDAWSLRKITSSLGATIIVNYESDEYKSVLNDNGSILCTLIYGTNSINPDSKVKLWFNQDNFNIVAEQMATGDQIAFVGLQEGTDPANADGKYKTLDSRVVVPAPIKITGINTTERSVTTDANFRDLHYYWFWNSTDFMPGLNTRANVLIGKSIRKFGGGVRVTKMSISDGARVKSVSYSYQRASDGKSYGFTTYEPTVLDIYDFDGLAYPITANQKKEYKKALYKDINSLLATAREVPSPGVMYEYVTVINQIKNVDEEETRQIEGTTLYQFEVYRDNMVGRVNIGTRNDNTNAWGHFTTHNLSFKKFTASIGNVKRIVQFDKDGRKISETINKYLHDGLENLALPDFMDQYKSRLSQFFYQGYLQERYAEVKTVGEQGWNPSSQVMATLSAREEYPCIPTGQTVINYVNGTQASTENLAYDFYSGALIKSVETDAYGNRFMTEMLPAYQAKDVSGQRVYGGMGLKINDGTNKNMLTQSAGSYTYKVDATNTKLGLVSAEVQTWTNSLSILDKDGNTYVQNNPTNGYVWRMESSYNWLPVTKTTDGITAIANFPSSADFNRTTPSSSDARWKKTSQLTKYDVYSKILEAKDIQGNYEATRMSYGSQKVEFAAGPANFYEIAYSGAEDYGIFQSNDMFVKQANGIYTIGSSTAHTGVNSLKLGVSGQKGFVYTVNTNNLTAGRNYKASVWVKPISGSASDVKLFYDINGTVKDVSVSSGATSTKSANGWYLINLIIKGTDITAGNTLNVGCRNDHSTIEAYIDDFRFQPLNAAATAYVYYKNTGELTYILDNSNLFTRFEYDGAGRLSKTYKEKLNVGVVKTTENEYNMGACLYHNNYPVSQTFTKLDCSSGYVGTMVVYTVPLGVYCSSVSQQDADNQAQIDLISYGQQNANIKGACVIGGIVKVTATLPAAQSIVNVFDAVTNAYMGTFACSNGITYYNSLPPGNYKFQIFQTDSVPRTVTIPGFAPQTGSNVTFNSISIGTTQLAITIQ